MSSSPVLCELELSAFLLSGTLMGSSCSDCACSKPGAGVTLELFCQQNPAAISLYPWLKPRGTLDMQVSVDSVDLIWQPGNFFHFPWYCSHLSLEELKNYKLERIYHGRPAKIHAPSGL